MKMIVTCAALAALMSASADARSWSAGDRHSETVRVADLDLSTNAGVGELSRRIGRAVDRICGGGDRRCEDEAWWSTERQVASAIRSDEWLRRLAHERAAQLRACANGCPLPVAHVSTRPSATVQTAPMPRKIVKRTTMTTTTVIPATYR